MRPTFRSLRIQSWPYRVDSSCNQGRGSPGSSSPPNRSSGTVPAGPASSIGTARMVSPQRNRRLTVTFSGDPRGMISTLISCCQPPFRLGSPGASQRWDKPKPIPAPIAPHTTAGATAAQATAAAATITVAAATLTTVSVSIQYIMTSETAYFQPTSASPELGSSLGRPAVLSPSWTVWWTTNN